MMQAVLYLANEHHIFVSVEPVCGWTLAYRYRIQEPDWDKFIHQGYYMAVDIESEELYEEYNDALKAALDYVRTNARRCGENDKYLTLNPNIK